MGPITYLTWISSIAIAPIDLNYRLMVLYAIVEIMLHCHFK